MRTFLIFQLWGPMSAWGDIAIGELRPSHSVPTRSALLGLVANCMGIPRTNEHALKLLDDRLRFAVRIDDPGTLIRDFHTAQTPGKPKYRDSPSRRDEVVKALKNHDMETMLSTREYRSDAAYTVAIWSEGSLDDVNSALLAPTGTPYLGRKSCPVGRRFRPTFVDASTIRDAFHQYVHEDLTAQVDVLRYMWEGTVAHGFQHATATERYDHVVSRQRWQFATRTSFEATERRQDVS